MSLKLGQTVLRTANIGSRWDLCPYSFVFGSCQEQAPFCAQLSRQLNAIVISVDYALGPYLQFPSANYDAEDVVDAVLDKREPRYEELRTAVNKELKKLKKQPVTIDAEHIAVSGFSSGGNLALNLALSIKPPTLDTAWLSPFPRSFPNKIPFLLFYPSLDARQLPSERPLPEGMPKKEKKGLLKSFDLEQNLMPTYLPREKAAHPRASPGLIPRGEEGLHPKAEILLYLPGYDSLSHQSQEWIKAMEVDKRKEVLKVVEVPGVVHGFNIFPDQFLTPEHRVLKRESYDLAVAFIREKWGM